MPNRSNRPQWFYGVRSIACPGLRPFYASEGSCAKIDAGIADIIRRLNDLGCVTTVSCSGLDVDHKEKRTWWRAYIGFREKPGASILRVFEIAGFYLDDYGCDFCVRGFESGRDRDGKDGSNERIAAKWEALRGLLNRSASAMSSPGARASR